MVYESPGLFDVTLTVTDANGQTNTITKSDLIDVYHSMPIQDGDVTLTDCRGLFLPSGGDCGHYGNSENFKMTVFPEESDRKVVVNFLVFKTQPNADVLSIYDGTSTNAPLIGSFSGSGLPDSITATNPQGALTFTFVSDTYVNFSGWVATLTCTEDASVNESCSEIIKLYPNPCKNSFTIEAEGYFQYNLLDCLGQSMLSGTGKNKTQIGTANLQPRIYLLYLITDKGKRIKKIVIEK